MTATETAGRSASRIRGWGWYALRDTRTGIITARRRFGNLVTEVGDQMYAERGAGIVTAPNAPTGMRLGTGTAEPTKSGANAALGTYVSGSTKAFDSSFPLSSAVGDVRRITYQCTWAAGVATATGIAEVVITNQTGPTEGAGAEANTIARALLRPPVSKSASDQMLIVWHHDVLGA